MERPPFHKWSFPDGSIWAHFYSADDYYLIRFPGLADFEISRGTLAVACFAVPGVSDGTVEHLFLNQVLPLVLSKQGKLVFHASAIETPAGVIAFMGASGRGKSTLAASFAGTGLRFLTDDALLIEEMSDGRYLVHPSHASIRLWDDSQRALVGDGVCLAPPVQYTSKARLLSGDALRHCAEARPLSRVYFLGDGAAVDVTFKEMKPSEAMIALVKNTFLLDIDAQQTLAAHFEQLSKMVALPIYYQLDYPRRFDDLPSLRTAIVEHALQDPSGI